MILFFCQGLGSDVVVTEEAYLEEKENMIESNTFSFVSAWIKKCGVKSLQEMTSAPFQAQL